MQKFIKINILFYLAFFLCCGISHALEMKAISGPAGTDPYAIINKVNILQSEPNQVTIKVFETGGGDPAMNGNKLVIHINPWDPENEGYTWIPGIDIYEVKDLALKGNAILIKCTEHGRTGNAGLIETVEAKYAVMYFIDKTGKVKDIIRVEKAD